MPSCDVWRILDQELERWAAAGRVARFWLRDDDAIAPTLALDRLLDLTGRHDVPLLLAVIPLQATEGLARRLRRRPDVLPCQHGARHRNHAAPGEKPEELGAHRPVGAVMSELEAARGCMDALFGDGHARGVLVPPWNRIAPGVVEQLPALGFGTLSTFGRPRFAAVREINADLDIMDWKATRQGHDPKTLVPALCAVLERARTQADRPIGVLTHHLAHGEPAWTFMETLLRRTRAHPAATWGQDLAER